MINPLKLLLLLLLVPHGAPLSLLSFIQRKIAPAMLAGNVAFSTLAAPAITISSGGGGYAMLNLSDDTTRFANGDFDFKRRDFSQIIAKGTTSNLQTCKDIASSRRS